MTIVVVTLTVSTLGYLVAQKVNYSALPTNPTLADSDQLQQSLESSVVLAPFDDARALRGRAPPASQ